MYIPASKAILRRITYMNRTTTLNAEEVDRIVGERGALWTYPDGMHEAEDASENAG